MEQNRFNIEDEFRQKLNQREIQPSEHAWDRLDAMLTVSEKQPKVIKINWLYIAAGFIGIILMATLFFKKYNKEAEAETGVVIENAAPVPAATPQEQQVEQKILTPTPSEAVAEIETAQPEDKQSNNLIPQIQADDQRQLAQAQSISNQTTQQSTSNIPVDVDQLLASVEQKESPKSNTSSVSIDAGSLLSQVDGELEYTFREKVIRTVSKNYKNVKVALANRNQE